MKYVKKKKTARISTMASSFHLCPAASGSSDDQGLNRTSGCVLPQFETLCARLAREPRRLHSGRVRRLRFNGFEANDAR